MKKFKSILLWITAVIPAIYTAVAVFFILPETVAAHFGANGTVDRYGSKYEAFILPAIILGINLLYFFIRKFIIKSSTDENSRTERNLDVIDTVVLCLNVMFNALCVMLLLLMKHPQMMTNVESIIFPIIATVIGTMFIIIGNIMPKTKPNSFVGMRMKFCMDTDEHWYIANRAGGIALVMAGICTVIAGLILRSGAYIFVMLIALIVFLSVASIYSYVIIKRENKG